MNFLPVILSTRIIFSTNIQPTFNTARMYPDNWFMWQFYNITKLVQNILQMNIANTAKYVFYLFNAIIGYITWNDDKKKGTIKSS